MTSTRKSAPSRALGRRGIIAGGVAGAALLGGALWRFTDLFVKHYAPTPYDDLLARLTDREAAAKLGAAALRAMPGFDPGQAAARLRKAFGGTAKFPAVAAGDVAAGRLVEADGWLLPQSVALLSALAAKV